MNKNIEKTTFPILKFLVAIFLLSACSNQAGVEEKSRLSANKAPINIVTEPANQTVIEVEVKNEEKQKKLHPMAIESLRAGSYKGGDFAIEETLANGTNYKQYVASYQSEGLKIHGLLTVPLEEKPEGGFPAIIFVHGYIPPKQYSTTGNYPTYQARLARSGFVTFKPDLRGHGKSEGEAVSAHFSEKYVVDTLHAIEYLKNHSDVNPEKIVYWGHSNGGEIGLRVALVSSDIKAASLWAGVVGDYEAMFETYNDIIPFLDNVEESQLVKDNGLPSTNPAFWDQLDPYAYLEDIRIPIQLQHGTNDISVPIELSKGLKESLEAINKEVEYYEYAGDDHNIGRNAALAFGRTIDFYKKNLKEEETPGLPMAQALERVTKKPFGIQITPETSPVKPEKFSGYHTGADFEVFPEEEDADVEIFTICSGPLIRKQDVSGYGGVAVQKCEIEKKDFTVLYGHLKLSSISAGINQNLKKGSALGVLGKGFSRETDNERRHLHLSLHQGSDVNFLGYVKSPELLEAWSNPIPLLKQ